MGTVAPRRMSDLIGMIYDCSIDPERWPQTLAEMCRAIECISGGILLLDLERSQHKFAYTYGLSSEWAKRYFDYSDDLTLFYRRAFSRDICPDGEPLLLSKLMERVGPRGQRIYDELTKPQGVSEMMQTVVLRQARRLAVFGANRHASGGELTDTELEFVRMLVPHIRRTVAISDILDAKRIELHTLAATLDSFNAGILVVADQRRILHANGTAQDMLSKRETIAAVGGILSVRDPQADRALAHAIELARADEANIGGNGIGVPLGGEKAAIAHVLPLVRGDLRTRLAPQATAAIFITEPTDSARQDVSAVAANFGLSPAEARMLDHLTCGESVSEAAVALRISAHTARTHLAHIFSKTGTSRQADLIALVNRIMPPVHRPKKG
jgi:DNA-binding CsgD family transcriptional regulator/PAS domain-containing protein